MAEACRASDLASEQPGERVRWKPFKVVGSLMEAVEIEVLAMMVIDADADDDDENAENFLAHVLWNIGRLSWQVSKQAVAK